MLDREHLSFLVFAITCFIVFTSISANAETLDATISLVRDPEPPTCVLNSGGIVTISWLIEHTTTPNYVYYKLEDPTRTIIYEDQTYPGSSGITVNRQWTVPVGATDGKYWISVEYWSFEAGWEDHVEVTFYVCSSTGDICVEKWEDSNINLELDGGDTPLIGWWICLETPLEDTFCKQTGENGLVCWNKLPLGDYRVYEVLPVGWTAIYPESHDGTLTEELVYLYFLNVLTENAVEQKTWGAIKNMYRK